MFIFPIPESLVFVRLKPEVTESKVSEVKPTPQEFKEIVNKVWDNCKKDPNPSDCITKWVEEWGKKQKGIKKEVLKTKEKTEPKKTIGEVFGQMGEQMSAFGRIFW